MCAGDITSKITVGNCNLSPHLGERLHLSCNKSYARVYLQYFSSKESLQEILFCQISINNAF